MKRHAARGDEDEALPGPQRVVEGFSQVTYALNLS